MAGILTILGILIILAYLVISNLPIWARLDPEKPVCPKCGSATSFSYPDSLPIDTSGESGILPPWICNHCGYGFAANKVLNGRYIADEPIEEPDIEEEEEEYYPSKAEDDDGDNYYQQITSKKLERLNFETSHTDVYNNIFTVYSDILENLGGWPNLEQSRITTRYWDFLSHSVSLKIMVYLDKCSNDATDVDREEHLEFIILIGTPANCNAFIEYLRCNGVEWEIQSAYIE